MPFGWAAGAAAVGSIASSAIQSNAAGKAADKQAAAANNAAKIQYDQQQFNNRQEQPFVDAGTAALPAYQDWYKVTAQQAGDAWNVAGQHVPQPMTQDQLEKTPGYQFNLSQGMKSIQNAAAAKGLGVSGAALQGASRYATGLADSTYQNQFNNSQTIYGDYNNQATQKLNQLNAIYGQIGGVASLGQNAAAQVGNQGIQSAGQIGGSLIGAGNAQAAGINASAAATGNALQSAGNAGINYLGLQQALGGNNGGQIPSSGFLSGVSSGIGGGEGVVTV